MSSRSVLKLSVLLNVIAVVAPNIGAAHGQTVSCCAPSGVCQDLPPAQCVAFGGSPGVTGSSCATNSCQTLQACCTQGGSCIPATGSQCAQFGGYQGGPGSTCSSQVCVERPCCLPSGSCIFASPQYCAANGGSSGPLGAPCPTTCPQPNDCKPKADGSACENVVCPDGTDNCKPKKVIITAVGVKVLECSCASGQECHVESGAGTQPFCAGNCPPGQICNSITTQTPDGTVLECRCDPEPSQCAPTLDRQQCTSAQCPTTTDKCQPHCINWYPPTNSYQINDCECVNPDQCHVDISGLALGIAPHCVGACPAGMTCKETQVQQADGSFTICCDCVPQQPNCTPNPTGTGCNQTVCPIATQQCIPKAVTQTAAGGFVVTQCDCDNPDGCHIQLQPGAAPFCTGVCPDPNQLCLTNSVAGPNGTKIYSCQCVCDPAKCDDHDPCTDDKCDPVTNQCVHIPNNQCQACCIQTAAGFTCQNLPPTLCLQQGGTPQGVGTDCTTVNCPPPPPPVYPKFSQRPTPGKDDLPSNIDPNGGHPAPDIVHADDFQSDGRPIVLVRWWGSYLNPEFIPAQFGGFGQPPFAIDGWLISFHQPLVASTTGAPAPPLGLYFAPAAKVTIRQTTIAPCDNHQVFGYEVRLSDCCLLCANVDTRSGIIPAQCDAFNEQHCFLYDLDIVAVVGRSWSGGCGNCLAVSTVNQAINGGNFWGWHTTALENGARQALKTVISNVNALNCPSYGPWIFATPICTNTKRENMAFELLTSVQPVPEPCPRACCLPSGACVDVTLATQCQGKLGPVGSSCATTLCPKPPVVIKWRSVRTHGTAGSFPIVLDPAASGNGPTGPTTESRSGGIQRIEVDFDQPVSLVSPGSITVSGRTTTYPGGVLLAPVAYSPSSVSMLSPTTMVLTFPASPSAGFLPNMTCYNFNVAGSVQNVASMGLVGDTDCNCRSLVGDATSDGVITLSDALLIKARWGTSLTVNPQCDVNVSGSINIVDSLLSKALVASPPRKCLCP